MGFSQTITPNPNIECTPGWCLAYVNEAYGVRKVYGSATAAWNASTTQHRDQDFPAGVWVPVWFALANEPDGHVALRAPDGSVYSTSDLGNIPHHHPDLGDLLAYYARYGMPLTYLGWTEDVEGTLVVIDGGTIAAQGSITITSEEDDMFSDSDRTNLEKTVNQQATVIAMLTNMAGWMNESGNETRDNVRKVVYAVASLPAEVLNRTFTLADGTVTNLAGVLSEIHATPAAGGTIPADPEAVVRALAAQLNK